MVRFGLEHSVSEDVVLSRLDLEKAWNGDQTAWSTTGKLPKTIIEQKSTSQEETNALGLFTYLSRGKLQYSSEYKFACTNFSLYFSPSK